MTLTEKQKFILAIVVVILIVWILWRASRPTQIVQPSAAVAYLIYADWCGYCTQLQPIWADMKSQLGHEIIFLEINETDNETVERLTSSYNIPVTGYPTIIGVNSQNNAIKYGGFGNGQHSSDYLRNFLQSLR